MDVKLVSVVITTRNRKGVVVDCLNSVLRMNYANFEIILVDNASSDGTVQAVMEKFPMVKVAVAEENLGLNGGKNLGQKEASGDYVFFLDSDTTVDKRLLLEMVRVAEGDVKIGVVTPKMYYLNPPNVIWYAGAKVNLLTSQTKNIGCNEEDKGQLDQVRETEFAPTAYLVKREVIERIEGHNEDLFMTYGDTDFGFRAREAGFKVVFCPGAKLWHLLGMGENIKTMRALGYRLPMRAYYFSRNRVIFMKLHAPKLNFIIFMLFFFPLFTFYFVYKIIRFGAGWRFLKPHLQGSIDGLKYAFDGKVRNLWR
ncbi:MAG: glycosyltransferase family 2 protein [bacterium]